MQLPMFQANQVRGTWVKSQEDLKAMQGVGVGVNHLNIRATARLMKNDKVVGYYCKDSLNREFAMDSEIIKKVLKSKVIRFYNLKLSIDNKLIHEPKGDRFGFDVPPEVFFNYEDRNLGIRMYYDANEKCVVLFSTRTKKYLKFRVQPFDDNRAWSIMCYEGNLIDFRHAKMSNIYYIIYRDMDDVDCIDNVVQNIIQIAKCSEEREKRCNK